MLSTYIMSITAFPPKSFKKVMSHRRQKYWQKSRTIQIPNRNRRQFFSFFTHVKDAANNFIQVLILPKNSEIFGESKRSGSHKVDR